MSGSIRLRPAERKALAEEWRRAPTPDGRLRAHILLLLDDGHSWALIAAVLFTSSSTVNRWRRRYLGGGLDAVLARPARRRLGWWPALVVRLVLTLTPATSASPAAAGPVRRWPPCWRRSTAGA
jgi:Homeodomain-like domain